MQLWVETLSQVRRTVRCRYCLYACVFLSNHTLYWAIIVERIWIFAQSLCACLYLGYINWMQQSHSPFITKWILTAELYTMGSLEVFKGCYDCLFFRKLQQWESEEIRTSHDRRIRVLFDWVLISDLRYYVGGRSGILCCSKCCIGQPVNILRYIYIYLKIPKNILKC